jgi:hypothetical protein
MTKIEKVLISVTLGAIFPIFGFLAVWWSTFALLPERLILPATSIGFLIGILVDAFCLRRWRDGAYTIRLRTWMAVHLFYSICMFGFFMGVPVFNVLLSVPAGLYVGARLARLRADPDEAKRMIRKTRAFTTGVLALLCAASAAIALAHPYTSLELERMLGLRFDVTRLMLVGVITIGGLALLALHWVITGKIIRRTYASLQGMTG